MINNETFKPLNIKWFNAETGRGEIEEKKGKERIIDSKPYHQISTVSCRRGKKKRKERKRKKKRTTAVSFVDS